MRLGVLDIGSNSAQLQVVDAYAGAPPLPAHAVKEPTLLADEIQPDGSISDVGIDRVTDSVGHAIEAALRLGVGELYAFVTSAIRDAANRDQVLDSVERGCGMRPQYLTGEEEARFTYAAVHRWYGWSAGRILLLDIGGGTLEIVLGRDAEPDLAVSLPLGAGRLTRSFLPDDPPTRLQLKAMRHHIEATLREIADRLRWEGPPARTVATSKTFKQLARFAGAPPQRRGPFAERTLSAADLKAAIPRLARLPAAERAHLRGISAPRARQILAGGMIARSTMKALNASVADICPWALREGILLHHLAAAHQPQDRHLALQTITAERPEPATTALRPITGGVPSIAGGEGVSRS